MKIYFLLRKQTILYWSHEFIMNLYITECSMLAQYRPNNSIKIEHANDSRNIQGISSSALLSGDRNPILVLGHRVRKKGLRMNIN